MGIQDRDYMRRPLDDGDDAPRDLEPALRPEQKLELFFRRNWKLLALVGLGVVAVVVVVVLSSSPS